MPSYWEFVGRYIDEALEHAHGELISDDIYDCLLKETMFLFVAKRPYICGAATCEVVQYARKKAIRVVTVAGKDFADWRQPLHDQIIDWGTRINADAIEAYVRAGLVPQLAELGYKQAYVGMLCEVRRHGKEIRHTDS